MLISKLELMLGVHSDHIFKAFRLSSGKLGNLSVAASKVEIDNVLSIEVHWEGKRLTRTKARVIQIDVGFASPVLIGKIDNTHSADLNSLASSLKLPYKEIPDGIFPMLCRNNELRGKYEIRSPSSPKSFKQLSNICDNRLVRVYAESGSACYLVDKLIHINTNTPRYTVPAKQYYFTLEIPEFELNHSRLDTDIRFCDTLTGMFGLKTEAVTKACVIGETACYRQSIPIDW